MEQVLKSIDQLASVLAAKLNESKSLDLDQIIEKLSKYASTLLAHIQKRNH